MYFRRYISLWIQEMNAQFIVPDIVIQQRLLLERKLVKKRLIWDYIPRQRR